MPTNISRNINKVAKSGQRTVIIFIKWPGRLQTVWLVIANLTLSLNKIPQTIVWFLTHINEEGFFLKQFIHKTIAYNKKNNLNQIFLIQSGSSRYNLNQFSSNNGLTGSVEGQGKLVYHFACKKNQKKKIKKTPEKWTTWHRTFFNNILWQIPKSLFSVTVNEQDNWSKNIYCVYIGSNFTSFPLFSFLVLVLLFPCFLFCSIPFLSIVLYPIQSCCILFHSIISYLSLSCPISHFPSLLFSSFPFPSLHFPSFSCNI